MDGLRFRVTPTLDLDGMIHVKLELCDVRGEQVAGVVLSEEWRVSPKRAGCACVSRACFAEGQALPGTFWEDEEGRRHFVVQAEAGEIGLVGQPIGG